MTRATYRQYRLFHEHHRDLRRDLWDHIEKRDPKLCWRWMGEHNPQGIAEYVFRHKEDLHRIQVHRYLYYAVYGELPHHLEHTCANIWCCNINHLEPSRVAVAQG